MRLPIPSTHQLIYFFIQSGFSSIHRLYSIKILFFCTGLLAKSGLTILSKVLIIDIYAPAQYSNCFVFPHWNSCGIDALKYEG